MKQFHYKFIIIYCYYLFFRSQKSQSTNNLANELLGNVNKLSTKLTTSQAEEKLIFDGLNDLSKEERQKILSVMQLAQQDEINVSILTSKIPSSTYLQNTTISNAGLSFFYIFFGRIWHSYLKTILLL